MKEAVIYARCANGINDGEMLKRQIEFCAKYAKENGLHVVKIYSEVGSGMDDKRDDFLRLMDESAKGQWDSVLVYTFDRFSRSIPNLVKNKMKLKEYGVALISVTQPAKDESLFEELYMSYAEIFRRR